MAVHIKNPPPLPPSSNKKTERETPGPSQSRRDRSRRSRPVKPMDQPARGKPEQLNISVSDAKKAREFRGYCKLSGRNQGDVFSEMWKIYCDANNINLNY